MEIPFRHRLSYRQAMNTVLIAFLLGTVLSGVQISYDLFKERKQMDATIAQVIGMLRESAGQAVFNVDRSMIRTVIRGLFEYRPICEVRIIDEFEAVLARKSRPPSGGDLKWLVETVFGSENQYVFSLRHEEQKDPVGRLFIRVDNYLVAASFLRRSGLVMISGLIRNIVLSCILTLFFYTTLTRPLLVMVRQVSSVDPSAPAEKKITIPENHEKDEMGLLVRTMNRLLDGFAESLEQRRAAETELKKHRDQLEQMVSERTSELRESLTREHEMNVKLNEALENVESANRDIMGGIRYAKMIQKSLLPPREEVSRHLPDSFSVWIPKEIVGGDIFFMDFFKHGFAAAVVDCTGHGVPGALMTMIACSGLRRIIRDEGCRDPSEILRQLNLIIKDLLHYDSDEKTANDGLDAAICFIETGENWGKKHSANSLASPRLTYAGARLPLFCVHEGESQFIKGDRQSIGYKDSDSEFVFANHVVELRRDMCIYMFTDGFEDQLGGERNRRFGRKRLKELLRKNSAMPFDEQRSSLLRSFYEYKGENELQDDITLLGFRVF
jgi:serine phosphatase RsbU (regulator of sigma subunit)